MGNYIIQGGERLSGQIHANGCKNAVLPIMAATILNGGKSIIHNCPLISDFYLTMEILKELGCDVILEGKTLTVDSSHADGCTIPEHQVKKMRSSILFLGSALGRFHYVEVAFPGGCEIGARPIDLHLKAVKKMGVTIREEKEYIVCHGEKLWGTKINLDFPSVGATENVMLAAVLARGRTVIYNAAREPEIEDLQKFLVAMGAKVFGAGTDTITIEGVDTLHDVEYTVMPDRIETGTFLIAAAITKGEIEIKEARPDTMRQIILRLSETGCKIQEERNWIYLKAPQYLKPIEIVRTQPFPGFPTDMQPQLMSLLTLAKGTSIIIETVFESRYKHIVELCRMGAEIAFEGRTAVIKGVDALHGAYVNGYDLRGGAALILAALAAKGESTVSNSFFVERGYEKMEQVLTGLGAKIRLET